MPHSDRHPLAEPVAQPCTHGDPDCTTVRCADPDCDFVGHSVDHTFSASNRLTDDDPTAATDY